jgi:TRAP transporter 4TM/12TM fusion protein
MAQIDFDQAGALEEQYDPEIQFRTVHGPVLGLVVALLFSLSVFHYYTAGFGILEHHLHTGVHLSFVLGLIFLVFSARKHKPGEAIALAWWNPGGVPLYDWGLFLLTVVCSMYIAVTYDGIDGILPSINFRIGDPTRIDVVFATIMTIIVLETTRRAMGLALPIICIAFIVYGIWGNYAPGPLVHPGNSWSALMDHLYMTGEGIFGLPVVVVATYVFHFVLFGVVATRIGLGQMFIDIAYCVAGRYAGGPAKVSVLSSAMFGMLSGSSIANTVTTGALTSPAMKRVGYQAHFAAAVEAAASTGGQITPPIMGAAAFLMIEFLEVPLRTILLAAMIPAALHFLAVIFIVHLEAKRLGLRGLRQDELPVFLMLIKRDWFLLLPLVLLITMIMKGFTPYWAAFWGITACLLIGFLNPRNRLTVKALVETFQLGAKYALAVGAAAASVGIIVGVITNSGMGFKVSFVVTAFAADLGMQIAALVPFGLLDGDSLTLFLTLVFVAIACIFMGAGLPTTATYIVLVTMAAPALAVLGVEQLVTHFFVFFYGVLADITPPVAVAAYAAAGIAGANPFRAGITAFKLGNAKALVPIVFVYAPSLLLVTQGFTWSEFVIALTGCVLGILILGAALTGYLLADLPRWQRWLLGIGSLFLFAPGIRSGIVGVVVCAPVLVMQLQSWKERRAGSGAVPIAD